LEGRTKKGGKEVTGRRGESEQRLRREREEKGGRRRRRNCGWPSHGFLKKEREGSEGRIQLFLPKGKKKEKRGREEKGVEGGGGGMKGWHGFSPIS